ncbi:hypothetical protein G8C93_00955 [Cellulosimicrobium cellulans]|uniref:hypothetical protein n=1 Tax=Cellulosimicrobium cellulans TaxID=1710 RepID=UPI0018833A19|nr:hypothetical protein [Cellulosimicrobium cellulans]MBE9924461.1 hypothetical protein [Cellulosimicrobium cellulans]
MMDDVVVPREEALARAAACIAEGRRVRDSLPVDEAARRAHHAGGPSVTELEELIRAQRAHSLPRVA